MKTLNFFDIKAQQLQTPIITIGVFDGVHKGHQTLLQLTAEQSRERGGEAVVITFTKHPNETITGKSPLSITSLEKRLELFAHWGITTCLLIEFNQQVAAISAEDFITDYLVCKLGIKSIIIGENFRFGKDGKGTPELLKKFAKKHHFTVQILAHVEQDHSNSIVSSTNIRNAIAQCDLNAARNMLGRPFSLIGKVVQGEKMGRTLGFPTANLELAHSLNIPEGVYSGSTTINNCHYPSLISVGKRPTFGGLEIKTEVYLHDFSGDLYGQTIETFVFDKIREQIKFANNSQLIEQMQQDREQLLQNWKNYSSAVYAV